MCQSTTKWGQWGYFEIKEPVRPSHDFDRIGNIDTRLSESPKSARRQMIVRKEHKIRQRLSVCLT